MKNIFKSTKNKKTIMSLLLAGISLFSFNFTPISIISNKIASAAKYEASETIVTESTSEQLKAVDVVSNLKSYFNDSKLNLNLTEYYNTINQDVFLDKIEDYLKYELGSNDAYFDLLDEISNSQNKYNSLREFFDTLDEKNHLTFISSLLENKYIGDDSINDSSDKKSIFYNKLANHYTDPDTTITSAEQDGVDETTVDFYADSESYKRFQNYVKSEVAKIIPTTSFNGIDGNKVAALIANNAPSQTGYRYGSSYEKNEKPFIQYESTTDMAGFSASPFSYQGDKQLKIIPYQTNSDGSFVVYAIESEDESINETYKFLGYKTISYEEAKKYGTLDKSTDNKFFHVPYSAEVPEYFTYLYDQLVNKGKINGDKITKQQYIDLFHRVIDNTNIKQSVLFVKYETGNSDQNPYIFNLYVKSEELSSVDNNYKYREYVKVMDSPIEDYVTLKSASLESTYKASEAGDVTLYLKQEIIYYTDIKTEYTNEFEQETKLDLDYEKVENSSKNQIYILDESENADENKVYQSLGYKILNTSESDTSYYYLIPESDSNYHKDFKLYYKFEYTDSIYVKNLLNIVDNTAKNAIYILESSVSSNLAYICKENNYIPVTKDDIAEGNFVKLNAFDDYYSSNYELYYKIDESAKDENQSYINVKKGNKIYQYTSSNSDFTSFYKTDADYNIDDYVKIESEDSNFKQGFDLYYKKVKNITSEKINNNTIYYYITKSATTYAKNSYYALSFYAYTSESATASVELLDENGNNILENATEIINFSTDCTWKKFVVFFATDLMADTKANLYFSYGSSKGISTSNSLEYVSGTVLFDEVKTYKINESDFNKQTINQVAVYEETEGGIKVDKDDEKFRNDIVIVSSSNRDNTNAGISNWNELFNFEALVSEQDILDNLDNDIDNVDGGFAEVTELWQYYISRDNSGKNNSDLLQAYQNAYKNSKVTVSFPLEKDEKAPETPADEDENEEEPSNSGDLTNPTGTEALADEDEKDEEEDLRDILLENTFNFNNKILKIDNTSASMPLGIVSQPIKINRLENYKISFWIYTAEEFDTATVKVISHIKTAKYSDYGVEVSAGASDVSGYIQPDDKSTSNEYRWLPVEFYVQGNAISDQFCNLVLLADKDSTIYFDNFKIEKITSDAIPSKESTRVYKLALTAPNTENTKGITNGSFNNVTISDINADLSKPQVAQTWTVTTDAVQEYVTAGIISSNNTNYGIVSDKPYASNLYVIDIEENSNIKTSTHKIYSSKISLSSSSVYKVTFDYYYNTDEFTGDIIANLYYDSYKAENKVSKIRTTINNNDSANKWTSITFFVATGTTSVSTVLELGAENAEGTLFIKNAYATTITESLNDIKAKYAVADETDNTKLNIKDSKINIVDFSTSSFSINKDIDDDDGIINSFEFETTSKTSPTLTTGKSSVLVSEFFTDNSEIQNTITVANTTYYLYDTDNDDVLDKIYKYPVYDGSTLEDNEEVTMIENCPFEIKNNKVIVGYDPFTEEYEISSKKVNKFNYNFEDKTIGNTTIAGSELNNSYSNNVFVIVNDNETDYTTVEGKYKVSLSSSSYYVLKLYVKTSDFENNLGLSISLTGTNLDVNWNDDLINTTKVSNENKDANGFVCYQIIITTSSTAIGDAIIKFSLGNGTTTGKGYAIISNINLTKFASKEELKHYSNIFVNEEDDSIVKVFDATTASNATTQNSSSTSEVTLATFFYIFSSLLLFITLIMAMVAIVLKKHPIKLRKKVSNDILDLDISAKTKDKLEKDQDIKTEGGIE